MFEPVHGSAPAIAGKDIANPAGAILTGAMMLSHLGFDFQAVRIETAVRESVKQGKTTVDIGGNLGTAAYADWVLKALAHSLWASAQPRRRKHL